MVRTFPRGCVVAHCSALLALLAVPAAPGAGATGAAAPPTDVAACHFDTVHFPSYPAIEPNVAFWTRVFGEWSLGQVVVHDLEHPAIVYEVVDLPGPVEERYTDEQLDFVEQLAEQWQERLRDLEAKVAAGDDLDDADKTLVIEIVSNAGSLAVRDADERVRTQRGLRERFRRGLEISRRYEPGIREIFRSEGLPEDLAFLPHVESSYQAAARSSAGAVGVWQFTRSTGRRYLAINASIDERLDPILAARGAADYLKEAYALIGDWPLALTSYNHGLYGMASAAEQHGRDYEKVFLEYRGRLFGFASKNFYSEFLAARNVACDPGRFFPEGIRPEPSFDHEQLVIEARTTPGSLARAYGIEPQELASINPAWNGRTVRADLAVPRGSTVWLPRGTLARLAAANIDPSAAWARQPATSGNYVVQPGDTLSTIASANGLSLAALRALNGLPRNANLIRVGQRLRVETAADGAVHVVLPGETLSTIAARHGLSLTRLRELNDLQTNDSLILPGQRLLVASETPSGIDAIVHVVRRGDTLIRIALHYGVAIADLLLQNGLAMDSVIYPGQRIRIPRPN